jgi:hypothetical protein
LAAALIAQKQHRDQGGGRAKRLLCQAIFVF